MTQLYSTFVVKCSFAFLYTNDVKRRIIDNYLRFLSLTLMQEAT